MGLNDIFPECERLHIPEPNGALHPAKYTFHQDGIELHVSSYPVAPWWKRLWRWIFGPRDIDPSALEDIEIDVSREIDD
jgi:hypothetical protein